MIVIFAALFGAILGGVRASRRKGNKLDIAQYAAVHGIAFGVVGVFLTIFVEKMLT
ncbi:apolipoprotein acyltransferase [Sagittula sp. S175]|uniref:apolipoprotein acyltransferase n=1 Tax=Sagittula sp. S175 TaxID=3415129 RepID=UPI003C7D263A